MIIHVVWFKDSGDTLKRFGRHYVWEVQNDSSLGDLLGRIRAHGITGENASAKFFFENSGELKFVADFDTVALMGDITQSDSGMILYVCSDELANMVINYRLRDCGCPRDFLPNLVDIDLRTQKGVMQRFTMITLNPTRGNITRAIEQWLPQSDDPVEITVSELSGMQDSKGPCGECGFRKSYRADVIVGPPESKRCQVKICHYINRYSDKIPHYADFGALSTLETLYDYVSEFLGYPMKDLYVICPGLKYDTVAASLLSSLDLTGTMDVYLTSGTERVSPPERKEHRYFSVLVKHRASLSTPAERAPPYKVQIPYTATIEQIFRIIRANCFDCDAESDVIFTNRGLLRVPLGSSLMAYQLGITQNSFLIVVEKTLTPLSVPISFSFLRDDGLEINRHASFTPAFNGLDHRLRDAMKSHLRSSFKDEPFELFKTWLGSKVFSQGRVENMSLVRFVGDTVVLPEFEDTSSVLPEGGSGFSLEESMLARDMDVEIPNPQELPRPVEIPPVMWGPESEAMEEGDLNSEDRTDPKLPCVVKVSYHPGGNGPSVELCVVVSEAWDGRKLHKVVKECIQTSFGGYNYLVTRSNVIIFGYSYDCHGYPQSVAILESGNDRLNELGVSLCLGLKVLPVYTVATCSDEEDEESDEDDYGDEGNDGDDDGLDDDDEQQQEQTQQGKTLSPLPIRVATTPLVSANTLSITITELLTQFHIEGDTFTLEFDREKALWGDLWLAILKRTPTTTGAALLYCNDTNNCASAESIPATCPLKYTHLIAGCGGKLFLADPLRRDVAAMEL